ncbi:TonB-dependent receptor plug domain-containing protein [Sphingomonas profundi]|uniref:TonB-dependent receptor plug domain-containing protein n=1 Tax=Alterirhizorhabdus profundi TaxID=2681549 RepID=UPI001E5DC154|nr:TonB-dependent receptor [Sphingomonas profundi]
MINSKTISYGALAVACLVGSHAAHAAEMQVDSSSAAPAAASVEPDGSEIIVTGTRATGITAAESAAPIKVLGAETLQHVGQPNLNQVLTQLVPSFTAQAFGGDTANLTLSARLRGLSPNHTLVLVNGKRRHGTANLAVLGGPYQGAATADLDLISPSSISRIEVLEDGAAAQYGSDAIAGVINIILKDDDEGASGYATAGKNYKVGGDTYAGTIHLATKLGEGGFVNVTAFHRFHDFTQVGGLDRRVTDTSGTLLPLAAPGLYGINATQRALYPGIPGFPFVNRISGDARSHLTNAQYNAGYDFGDIQLYSFGSYSRRIASAYENVRVPTRVSRVVNGVTIYPFPNGFNPREKIREEDYSGTGGVKGEISGIRYDLSYTYGEDKNSIFTVDSANASLYADTGLTPRNFYDGFFRATEWTVNADFSKEFDVGMAGSLNVAAGYEHRKNTYQIGSGDPLSYYKEGGQSYPGFRPSDAGRNTRNNEAVYLDIAALPIEGLKVDGAVRYEHYSDFGGTTNYKGTARYDFSDMFALRGTVATGFRAPTLAEGFYSATNVGPTTAFVQLPANSAAAKLLGFNNLRPEKSTNFSLGTVIRPVDRLTVTIDAYQIRIRNRILGSGTIYSGGGATNYDLVRQAIVANGNVLDPQVTQTGVNLFTNGATTRTRGIDLVASYLTDFGDAGTVNWTLSGNYNKTTVRRIGTGPTLTGVVASTGATVTAPIALFDAISISNLEDASPKVKFIASAFYTLDKFSATLRGTVYGKSSNLASPDGGTFYEQKIKTAFIGDIELNYKLTSNFELSAGANNVFNKRPPTVKLVPGTTNFTLVNGGNQLDAPLTFSPYGINGGYYYARVNFSF